MLDRGQIVITGASKGIGAAIASEMAQRGYDVVCLSRTGTSDVGHAVACDIAGLVNNAGVHILGSIATLTTEDFNKTIALNTTAVMVAAREAYPHLKQNGGTIVNIGSFFDKLGVPDNLAYCASKAAVAAMTRCMAVEWARDGIRVMNVAPGYIETDLNRDFLAREKVQKWMASRIPVGKPGKASDVAKLVAAIFGESIGFLTGETIYIDGAQGMNH